MVNSYENNNLLYFEKNIWRNATYYVVYTAMDV